MYFNVSLSITFAVELL